MAFEFLLQLTEDKTYAHKCSICTWEGLTSIFFSSFNFNYCIFPSSNSLQLETLSMETYNVFEIKRSVHAYLFRDPTPSSRGEITDSSNLSYVMSSVAETVAMDATRHGRRQLLSSVLMLTFIGALFRCQSCDADSMWVYSRSSCVFLSPNLHSPPWMRNRLHGF